jgi:hypothetical protein
MLANSSSELEEMPLDVALASRNSEALAWFSCKTLEE